MVSSDQQATGVFVSTKIDQVQHYAATPTEVFAMLSNPKFVESKCLASGSIEASAQVNDDDADGKISIVGRRVLPANLPSFAKSFVGETIVLTETQNWDQPADDQSRTASFVVDFGKNPISFSGEIELKPAGAETTVETIGKIKCSVPFVGGKIEKVALGWIERYLDKEQKVGNEWLSGEADTEGDSK
jgi:hypothetical protein